MQQLSLAEQQEIWLPVPGYEGLYEVSTFGRVWSVPRAGRGGGATGRIRKAQTGRHGHQILMLCRNGVYAGCYVHQLVLLAFLHPCPEGMEVRHLDGNARNNRVSNLVYDTHDINMQDRRIHGTDHQANKTHCPRNHEYTPDNIYYNAKGGRNCRRCNLDRAVESNRRRRAARSAAKREN